MTSKVELIDTVNEDRAMVNMSELIGDLTEQLTECDFTDQASVVVGAGHPATAISTNGKSLPKFICTVTSLPPDVNDAKSAAAFMQTLRKGLTGAFRGFPRPKRLGTCTVLLGGRQQCKDLAPHKSQLIDQRGMHVNVMLGTVLVDTETFSTRSDVTWGLMDIATPFSRIQTAVDSWCAKYRQPARMTPSTGRALKIA